MTEWTVETIRKALVRTDVGLGRPYPEAARSAALAWAQHRQQEGLGVATVADELGISPTTLRKWQQEREPARAAFQPVALLEPTPSAPGLVVHAPGGLRIEGLSVAELAELVRRLL